MTEEVKPEDVKPLAFGPMPASQEQAAPATLNEDQLVARILAALGKSPEQAAPGPEQKQVSEEDKRVLDVLSRIFPTGRDAVVKARYSVGTNLFVVEVAYTPNTGVRRDTEALVFDNGDKIYVFGAV